MSNKQNENWNWNWEWDKHSGEHQKSHKNHRRHKPNMLGILFVALLCGRQLVGAAGYVLRSLANGLSSGLSSILSVFTSTFRASSGTAILGGMIVGIIIGLYVYKNKLDRGQDAADEEEEETAGQKESAQADPVPIPMTLGNTPSTSDEEFVPQVYNTFGN